MTRLEKVTHTELQNRIVKLAKYRGWKCQYFWRNFHSPKGWPDLFMCRKIRGSDNFEVVVAELKTEFDKPTKEQLEWLSVLSKVQGIRIFCWYPNDWDSGIIEKVLE